MCSELPLGCRCTPISHVAVPSGGGVTQLWTWGGSMHFLACLNDRNGSAHFYYVEKFMEREGKNGFISRGAAEALAARA